MDNLIFSNHEKVNQMAPPENKKIKNTPSLFNRSMNKLPYTI